MHSGLIFAIFIILLVSPLQSQVLALPAGDAGGLPTVILGPFAPGQPVVFTVEYNPGAGPLQKVFSPFPILQSVPFTEIITVGAGPDITDWHEEAGRIISGTQITDKLFWQSASITLNNGETCSIVQPVLINTCGNITIIRDTSGALDPQNNPIFDLLWFDFPNNPQSAGQTFRIDKVGFYQFVVTGGLFGLGVNEFPTSQPAPFCGDGTVDPGEQCELPNTATCDAQCLL